MPNFLQNTYELQGRSARTLGEIPAVGVHDIGAGHDGRQHRSQPVTRRTVGMEIDRNRKFLLQQPDQRSDPTRRNQARHVLDRNHIGAERSHLFGLIDKIGVGEDGLRLLPAHQAGQEPGFGIFGVDRIAHGAIGDAAVLLHVFDRRFHIVHVVQRIEDTHDAQTALDGVAAEPVDDLIGIGGVSEEVAAARKRRQLRDLAHRLADRLETSPGILVQIAHHRIGHGAAPNLHCIKIRILIIRQTAIDLRLAHSRRE